MARRPTNNPAQIAILDRDQIQAGIARLGKALDKIKQFDPESVIEQYDIPQVNQLRAAIDDALVRTFGPDTLEYRRYKDATEFDNGPHNYADEVHISEVRKSLARSKSNNIALLEQAIESLSDQLAELPVQVTTTVQEATETKPKARKAFVVHGHDEGAREAVARFLEKMGFEAIILHERPNQGRTIIEKVEAHGDVGFAVVLLTPDDEGGLLGQTPQPRARQNVILELGYFIGRLGRSNVCALKRGNLEIPTDFGGVVYGPFDDTGAWRMVLARELEAAHYDIDWNQVMRP